MKSIMQDKRIKIVDEKVAFKILSRRTTELSQRKQVFLFIALNCFQPETELSRDGLY